MSATQKQVDNGVNVGALLGAREALSKARFRTIRRANVGSAW